MHVTRALPTGPTDALTGLVISGPLRSVTANGDGSWTVVPVAGPALLLTGAEQINAYVERATHGTGPQALAPARVERLTVPDAQADEDEPGHGCGCHRATGGAPAGENPADLMHARTVAKMLTQEFRIRAGYVSVSVDDATQAAMVRVETSHGLYALHVPPRGGQYVVRRNGRRDGVIGARRIPSTSDTSVTLQFGAYLRDRGAL
ncbi:hypothetical protein ACFV9E_37185 [Streptomyces sp. NPDC059835]|uniref:hypothetical protein n=1 Tax=Streptomyces sp. NPDC059835 TaxID=3346967 RepID=UPI003651E907